MRIIQSLACLMVVSFCSLSFAAAPATQPASAAFEKVKSLEGDWKGKDEKGDESNVSYKIVADGTTVMETLNMHGGSMVTMYATDNTRVLMTHYCIAHNQPRMAADALAEDGKSIQFKFVDATGMQSPNDGHMHQLRLSFVDADHLKQEWTFNADGKDQFTEMISLERVKK